MSTSLPMMENILAQPASLERVLRHHTGAGASALTACARLLRSRAGRLVISGMGASFYAAMPAAAALARHGLPVHLADSSELLHFPDRPWTRHDVAVLISRSGGSVEVLRLAEQMRAAGVSIVGVTNIAGSPLTMLSNETLLMDSAPDQIIAVQTYTGTLLTLLLLADQAGAPGAETLRTHCAEALPLFRDFVLQTAAESEGWREFLGGDGPLILLGRGGALAAVHEGSLLFHETAKLAAIGISSGQFRHGPVEAISRDTRVIVIGTPSPTRSLDWRLAVDLEAMGARVRWIGPPCLTRTKSLDTLGTWPAEEKATIPDTLTPLFDIVPVQLAAFHAALARGITPGDFRYAAEITADEAGFPLLDKTLAGDRAYAGSS